MYIERENNSVLEKVGMLEKCHVNVGKLSGGEKQRVCIARALINGNSVILADEPSGNLDSYHGDIVMKLLEDLSKEGRLVVLVTHNLEDAKLIYNNKVQKGISVDILSGEEELNKYGIAKENKSYQSNNQECDLWISYRLLEGNKFHIGEKLQLRDKDGKMINGIIKGTLKKCDENTIYISFFSLSK